MTEGERSDRGEREGRGEQGEDGGWIQVIVRISRARDEDGVGVSEHHADDQTLPSVCGQITVRRIE